MIAPFSIVSRLVNLSAVCVSIPASIEILIAEPPPQRDASVNDLFEDLYIYH